MNIRRSIRTFVAAATSLVVATACDGGGDHPVPPLQTPAADLTGTWSVSETEYGNCQGVTYPQSKSYSSTVTQTGNAVVFTTPEGSYSGTISGLSLTWSFSRPYGQGTVAGTFTGTAGTYGNLITGSVAWTWTSATDAYTCRGTTSVLAERFASQAPETPSGLSAVAGNSQVTLTWNTVATGTRYKVYRATSPGVAVDAANLASTYISGRASITMTDQRLTNGTTYYYVVTASNTAGESPPSSEVSALPLSSFVRPETPANLAAVAGSGRVTLSFDPVVGATTYRVYRATSPGQMTTYAALAGHPVTTFAASGFTGALTVTYGLIAGTTYYFVVTAGNLDGESDPSAEVSATPY